MYDHYSPAIVEAIQSRSEFLTPYTPYQPEVSQGGLQVMFEFQTAISELTGLPVANASLYEGPSAVASAAYLALGAGKGRRKLVVSRGLHPHSRATLETYGVGFGAEIAEVGLEDGATDAEALAAALGDDVAAVFVQNPNFLGSVEDLESLAGAAHEAGALCVARSTRSRSRSCARRASAASTSPSARASRSADGSTSAVPRSGSSPRRGASAADARADRGETADADGRRGFVLALQTREQRVRREKATHNICTSQALNALGGTVYLAWLGQRGFVELGELLVRRTAYARRRLAAIEGVELLHEAPVVREFAITVDAPVDAVLDQVAAEGIAAGYPLARDYPEYDGRDPDRDHRAPLEGRDRPPRRDDRSRDRGHGPLPCDGPRLMIERPPASAQTPTPVQREPRGDDLRAARFEGRRAATLPAHRRRRLRRPTRSPS